VYKIVVVAALLAVAVVAPVCGESYGRLAVDLGGGVSNPVGQAGRYAGTSGTITTGVGYNFDDHHAVIAEFMWAGLPPSVSVQHSVNGPLAKVNLYTITANYRYKIDKIRGSHFGVYAIGGGGWYYRYTSINGGYVVPVRTACQPVYEWWGYVCSPDGFVDAPSMTYKFLSAGGVNAGVGVTLRLGESNWKVYAESRYHYAFSRIPTTVVLMTFGLRFR
jgi:hypothetical protein